MIMIKSQLLLWLFSSKKVRLCTSNSGKQIFKVAKSLVLCPA